MSNTKIQNIYDFPNAISLVVSGDIHGDFTQLVYKCCIQYGMTDTVIIVAGDCGFGFEKPGYYENIYKRCRERLSKANNYLLFVRGNHDNPAYFRSALPLGSSKNLQPIKHRRWMTLPDYSVVKACGHTILCVGGATSIDRTCRMNSKYYHFQKPDAPFIPNVYWPNESPIFDLSKLDAINEVCAIDTVITHTSPSFCELSSHQGLQSWTIRDEDLLDDVKRERKVMDDLHAYLYSKSHPLRFWLYGHFHQSWHSEIDGIQYNMLDCMELREVRS